MQLPPLLQNQGRAGFGCTSFLGDSPACANTSAWMSNPSQWVLEAATGTNLYFSRSVVRVRAGCSADRGIAAAL